jgi:hypothetical protein
LGLQLLQHIATRTLGAKAKSDYQLQHFWGVATVTCSLQRELVFLDTLQRELVPDADLD